MSQDTFTLAAVSALEGGSRQAQADVSQSVANRLQDGTYGTSITNILTTKGQYQVTFKDPTASSGSGTNVAPIWKKITDEDSAVAAMSSYYQKRNITKSESTIRQEFRSSLSAIQDPTLQQNARNFVGNRTEFLSAGSNAPGSAWRGSGADNKFFIAYGSEANRAGQNPPAPLPPSISAASVESSESVQTAKDQATQVTTTSDNPVPVPDGELNFNNPYFQLDNERLDAEIEANRKQIDELNKKSSDLWTDEEKEKYKMLSAETEALFAAKLGNDLQEQAAAAGCVARETAKGFTFKNTLECEKLFNSVAFIDALTRMQEKRDMPDPCGTSEMSKINTQLQKFFTVLKGIKKYADLYVNGTINKIQNLTALIRSTSQIIGAVLKTLVNRLRDFLIDKIRKGIEDLIDMILPTVLKSIKATIIQTVIDNIFCAFKDVISNISNLVVDFLFELIGKIVNVPFCAAQQFTNALVNNVAAIVDKAIGPILNQINDVLGGVTRIVGNVFQALDYILGFEAFLCAKPNCPEIKTFKASPWGGPTQSQIDNFSGFLAPLGGRQTPTAEGIIGSATDFIDGIEIFGEPLGNSAGTIPSNITECDVSAYKCGPPQVEIFGGGGVGAAAEVVVDNIGRTIGVNITNRGSGYTRPPFVSFVDGCEDTFTSGYAVISESGGTGTGGTGTGGTGTGGTGTGGTGTGGTGTGGTRGEVTDIILTTTPVSVFPDGRTEFDPPSETETVDDEIKNDFVVCLEGFRILDTGIGYTTNDNIIITPDIPGLEATVKMTEFGQIISIQIGTNACGLPGYPDIEINSPTGEGTVIEPILSFTRVSDFDESVGDIQLELDGPIDTLRGRSVLVERGFTRKDLVRVVDCVS